ncbi:MAG: HAD hydrolase-like protein [Alphaproteobacteria bacterium]|nr:HAD hydrolase-like protein [Alphaproteobacteria bacterium]
MLPELSVIFLDLDGTLIESVGIKDEAFQELFSDYPDKLPEIMEYHTAHNAVVRYDKFRHIVPNILKEPLYPEREVDLAERFSSLVFDKIVKTNMTPGALSFLNRFLNTIPMVLISMTPEIELRKIIEQRKMSPFFNQIYGAEWQKDQAMLDYMKHNNIPSKNCVYIGDTPEDYTFSQQAKVAFIGRDSGRNFQTQPDYLFHHMGEITTCLEALFTINPSQPAGAK